MSGLPFLIRPRPIEAQTYVREAGSRLTHRLTRAGDATAACGLQPTQRWLHALTPVRTHVETVAHLCPQCFPLRADGVPRLPGEES